MADFGQLRKWVEEDWKAQDEYREAIEQEQIFDAGHQWSEAERVHLEDNARIPIVFNRVQPILQSVVGLEITNRTEVAFVPREIGDIKANEVLTQAAQWFRDQANAEEAESEAFRDLLICGVGFTETSLDFEEDPEGQPKIERIDPIEMGWDARSRKRGLSDARRIFRVHKMSREAAEEQWPDADPRMLNADWIKGVDPTTTGKTINHSGDEYAAKDSGEDDDEDLDDLVTIVQIQWRELEQLVEYVDPTSDETDQLPAADFDRVVKEQFEGIEISHRRIRKPVWRQAYLGQDIIEENQPSADRPTFCALTGLWDRQDKRFYGLLRIMMDPQKYANKWLSLVMHIIATNSKGGVMAESGAVEDTDEFVESWAAADSISWLKPGGIQRVLPKPQPPMPQSLMTLTEFAIQSIRDVSGVNLELQGLREANQAGVLEAQRRKSAMTTLARYFDAMRHYRKVQGHVILHFLREYIAPTGRLVRILEEGREQYVPLAMDMETVKYDVIVDEAPSSPDQKERTWEVLKEMMPLLMEGGLSMEDWADVIEYSPLPSSFVDKVREKAQQGQQDGEPSPEEQMQQAAMQLEQQKMQLEQQKMQVEAQKVQADLAKAQMDMQIARAEAETRSGELSVEQQTSQAKAQLDAAQAQNIMAQAALNDAKRRQVEQDIELESKRVAAENKARQQQKKAD